MFPFYILEESLFFDTKFNSTFLAWVLFAAISPGIIAFSLYTKVQRYLGASLTGFTLYLFAVYGAIFGIILFEGGLTLKLGEVKKVGGVIGKLISLGSIITFFGAGVAAHYAFGLSWQISFLFAGLVIVLTLNLT